MNHRRIMRSALGAGAVMMFSSTVIAGEGIGPDAGMCSVANVYSFGNVGPIQAFAVSGSIWNLGDEMYLVQQQTDQHPVVAQHLYRYFDGRFEMIGMSWVVHVWCALQLSGCGPCQGGGGCPQWLQPGCRKNLGPPAGEPLVLGPRSDVNASTGEFPSPWTEVEVEDLTSQRLQVQQDDLDPALNHGAVYFGEAQIIHPQEGTSDRRHNNASFGQFDLVSEGETYEFAWASFSVQLTPAIFAWQALDPQVVIETVDTPGEPIDGRFHLGYRVWDNGDGTWRYEYALHNMNSHRSARAFATPLAQDVNVLSMYYKDVKHHSGEPYSNEDWSLAIGEGEIAWSGLTFDDNENANALRWGTTFNFGFVTNAPPVMGEATIRLFRPGTPDAVAVPALIPGAPAACVGDLTGSGTVGVPDILALLGAWGECPDSGACSADISGDGVVNVLDLLVLLAAWGACP